jgi:hypothetical protein
MFRLFVEFIYLMARFCMASPFFTSHPSSSYNSLNRVLCLLLVSIILSVALGIQFNDWENEKVTLASLALSPAKLMMLTLSTPSQVLRKIGAAKNVVKVTIEVSITAKSASSTYYALVSKSDSDKLAHIQASADDSGNSTFCQHYS